MFKPMTPEQFALTLRKFQYPVALGDYVKSTLFLRHRVSSTLVPSGNGLQSDAQFSSILA